MNSSSKIFSAAAALALVLGACGEAKDGDATDNPDDPAGGDATVNPACPPPEASAIADRVTLLPGVTVTTIAGDAQADKVDGPVAAARFANPVSVLVESAGTVVVADFDNDLLRRIDVAGGTVSTLTKQTAFQRPFGMTLGADGALYVDTDFNPKGEKTSQSGTVWRVDAQTGTATVVGADLGRPRGLAARSDGRLVLSDYQNMRIRVLDPMQQAVEDLVPPDICAVGLDGGRSEPPFAVPYGIVALPDERFIVADSNHHLLRAVTASGGALSTFAGAFAEGTVDGPALEARFARPVALAVDGAGNIYVSDAGAHRIRRVAVDGTVTTVAGDGVAGYRDGAGVEARFFGQEGIAVTPDGHTLYVADGTGGEANLPYNRVRKIEIGGGGGVVTP